MAVEVDYYELLEVERGADDAAIKSSYRKLAMRWHPDRNPGDAEAEARFKAISEAYDCLKDPQKRAAYDRFGHAAFQNGGMGGGAGGPGGGFSDLGDIFETIFGSAFGGGGRQQARRGADLRYDLEVSLEEAFHGKQAQIEIEVAATCEPCDGSGAEPGTGTRRCNLCGGHGQVRAQQGFFMVERTCPTCHGRGEVIEKPCRKCGENINELDPAKVDRISPDDCPGVREGGAAHCLRGVEFYNFGAFFSRAYRENDYLWGRLHGAERMIDLVASALPAGSIVEPDELVALKREAFLAILDEEEGRLRADPGLVPRIRAEISAS